MDFNTIQSLQEAYQQVNENLLGSLDKVARDTAGKVGGEIGAHKGRQTAGNIFGIPEKIGRNKGTQQGQQMYDKAKETIGGLLNQEYEPDAFDIVLEYLVAEGYADTNEEAIVIMSNMSEEWRQSIVEAGMNPSETPAAKQQKTKAAVEFFTKPIKPLPPYEARKPRFPALTVPDFGLGSNKKESPRTPTIKRDDARTEKPKPPVSEKPKTKPPATSTPPKTKPPETSTPPKTETPKTEAPKPKTPNPLMKDMPKGPSPTPKGGEVAMSKLGDKSDYSAAATAKMSDRTKNILGTKDSATGQTIRKPADFRSPREKALNQSFDLFDVVFGHLLDEGYADTEEAALAIMANMSEKWKQSILEG